MDLKWQHVCLYAYMLVQNAWNWKVVVHGTEVQSENGNILTSIRLCRIATKTMWWTNIIHQCEQVLCQIASFSLCGHASGGYLMHCNTCAADNFRYVQLRCRNTTFTDPFIPSSISFHFMSCHFISFRFIQSISFHGPCHFTSLRFTQTKQSCGEEFQKGNQNTFAETRDYLYRGSFGPNQRGSGRTFWWPSRKSSSTNHEMALFNTNPYRLVVELPLWKIWMSVGIIIPKHWPA